MECDPHINMMLLSTVCVWYCFHVLYAWQGLGGHLQEAWSQHASDRCGTACGESRPRSHFAASWAVVRASNCRHKKHRAALVIKQLNTLPFQLVGFCRAEPEMGGLVTETVLQVCETSDPAEVSTSRTLKPDRFREGCATANLMSPWIRASKKGLSLWHQ